MHKLLRHMKFERTDGLLGKNFPCDCTRMLLCGLKSNVFELGVLSELDNVLTFDISLQLSSEVAARRLILADP